MENHCSARDKLQEAMREEIRERVAAHKASIARQEGARKV